MSEQERIEQLIEERDSLKHQWEAMHVVASQNRDIANRLEDERDAAQFLARAAYDFIEEGCFADDVEMGNPGAPEWELWVKKHVYQELVHLNPWVKEKQP